MVVDDDPVTLELVRMILENRGYEIVTRDNALGTTAAILRERPDVVLLDIRMPGLRGDEILTAIREEGLLPGAESTAFILHSGEDKATLDRRVAETGALGAIEKTPDFEAFAEAFDALLRQIPVPGPEAAA